MKIADFFSNKIIQYVISRYFIYLIQFINSILIAIFLGAYYFGIWGFFILALQYLSQLNFGISHSSNAIISVEKNNDNYVKDIFSNAFMMLIILSFFFIFLFLLYKGLNLNLGDKYMFSIFSPYVLLIGILTHFNTFFSNVFRVYGKITEIIINQSLFPLIVSLLLIFFFKHKNLLNILVTANLISFIISFFIFLLRSPVKLKFKLSFNLMKKIQTKGFFLFIYNTSFYLIFISTRSFVSTKYTVSDFGLFSFAFSLANSIQLLLESLSFLFFPKLLNRLHNSPSDKADAIFKKIRIFYTIPAHFIVHIAIFFAPFLMIILEEYKNSLIVFNIIALTIVLQINVFGYVSYLIANNYEKQLGIISLFSLLINISISIVFIFYYNVILDFAMIPTLIALAFYNFFVIFYTENKIRHKKNKFNIINNNSLLSLFLPYILSITISLLHFQHYLYIIPLSLFVIFNYRNLRILFKEIFLLVNNSSLADI